MCVLRNMTSSQETMDKDVCSEKIMWNTSDTRRWQAKTASSEKRREDDVTTTQWLWLQSWLEDIKDVQWCKTYCTESICPQFGQLSQFCLQPLTRQSSLMTRKGLRWSSTDWLFEEIDRIKKQYTTKLLNPYRSCSKEKNADTMISSFIQTRISLANNGSHTQNGRFKSHERFSKLAAALNAKDECLTRNEDVNKTEGRPSHQSIPHQLNLIPKTWQEIPQD